MLCFPLLVGILYPCGCDIPWGLKVLQIQLADRRSRNGEGTPTFHFWLPLPEVTVQDTYPRSATQPFSILLCVLEHSLYNYIKVLPILLASSWIWPIGRLHRRLTRGWRVTSGCPLPSFPYLGFDSGCCVLLRVTAPFLSCGPLQITPILTPRNCTILFSLRSKRANGVGLGFMILYYPL